MSTLILSKCRAIIVNLLCFFLVIAPCLALPVKAHSTPSTENSNANKLPQSSGVATLPTQQPDVRHLPNIDEIKQKAADPELKKLIKTKEKLPAANRCRPGNKTCQEYWKKLGNPSTNIGQNPPPDTSSPFNSFSNLLAWNSFSAPHDWLKGVSDVPVNVGKPALNAAPAPAMVQGGVSVGRYPTEMAQGRNRQGSDDLFSGNYHWSVPIVGLPGRAGHDLGLGLSYNSHVWVKSWDGNAVTMQMLDYWESIGNPGGGFMLGLPFLRYSTHQTRNNQSARLLVLPSGKAIELVYRGAGAGNSQIYESIDGSVLRLVSEGATQYLFFPDGTRLRFWYTQCTEMRDRNGNLITATYDPTYGLLTKLTDTLGREITVHYYDNQGRDFFEAGYAGYFEITDLKQVRKDENGNAVTVTLAQFGYSDIPINTNFSSPSTVPNGTVLPMLTRALLADGSLYKFDYTSYGQVYKISRHAPQVANPSINSLCGPNVFSGCDFRLLSYATYNLPSTNDPNNNGMQTDCPRFTSRFDWAMAWNEGVTTTFDKASDTSWAQVTTPDGTTSREYYNLATNNSESWKDGLPFKMEAYAPGQSPGSSTPKKTTLTTWENHLTWGARVLNTTITDGENNSSRFTKFEYNQNYNLLTDTYSYKGTGPGDMIGSTSTTYLLSSPYISTSGFGNTQRWIIGLPSASYNYHPTNAAGTGYATLAKTTYQYDQSGYLEHQLPGAGTIINHDTTNFGSSFLTGRGNLTSVTRWDSADENNSAKAITSYTKYNTSGSPITQYLPNNNLSGRTTNISYQDSWSDSTANNTLAYPTTIQDPDTNSSTIRYRYDIGAVTRTQDPKMLAADPSKGIVTTYDALGRVTRVDNQFSGSYIRTSYEPAKHWVWSATKADDAGNELYTTTNYDGYGRRRSIATAHPNSTLGHRVQHIAYDTMGRLWLSSNPTEINSNWNYVGGDDNGGYSWHVYYYDWKGRPTIQYNQDGTTKNYAYGGCGCTGEATVTVTDEVGRKTRTISDAFLDHSMQVDKTEVLDANNNVYSTMVSVTKPLERKSYVRQFVGAVSDYTTCPTNNCREESTEYDGLGRLLKKHRPIESLLDAQGNITTKYYTNYEYYPDGSYKKVTDPRGAIAKFYYNLRGLTKDIKYNEQALPPGVAPTSDVSFQYDVAGNREQMTDGQGVVNYNYDALSRLSAETRTFTGLTGTYTLSYDYTVTSQLKQINYSSSNHPTDNFSTYYNFDLAGRVTSITGTPFAGVSTYSSGIQYRAWDGVKATAYGNGGSLTTSYDTRLRLQEFKATSPFSEINFNTNPVTVTTTIQNLVWGQYQYYNNGQVKLAQDKTDSNFDRAYVLDDTNRLSQALTGQEARDYIIAFST